MIVAGRICVLCGAVVTKRTVRAHYVDRHQIHSAADFQLACWPDGGRVLLQVDDDTFEVEVRV